MVPLISDRWKRADLLLEKFDETIQKNIGGRRFVVG